MRNRQLPRLGWVSFHFEIWKPRSSLPIEASCAVSKQTRQRSGRVLTQMSTLDIARRKLCTGQNVMTLKTFQRKSVCSFGADLRRTCGRLLILLLLSMVCVQTHACDCGCENVTNAGLSFSDYDFFTNYGEYVPRSHCMRKADGTSDWPWIITLITLCFVIVAGYVKIVVFWARCYLDEKVEDRDQKLKNLACIFVLCAVSGYAFSVVMFFWPVYRMQALSLVALSIVTWRFASDLEPFRKTFTAHRLQRELNEALQSDNKALASKNDELTRMHQELTETMEELRKTNQDLDQFAYAASHDLRSPLRAIESLSQFVIEDVGDLLPEGPMGDLRQLQSRAQRMERMLNDLLNYSRQRFRSFESESFSIKELAQETIALLDIPKDFRVVLPAEDTVVLSPRAPLGQVLRNLVDNAIKHHDLDQGEIKVESVEDGEFVRIRVIDDGPGIALEDHSRIFEIFSTLSRRDELDTSGMGLALVKRVVEAHGGIVSISSSGDRGATFEFTWPHELVSDNQTEESSRDSLSIHPLHEELCHV